MMRITGKFLSLNDILRDIWLHVVVVHCIQFICSTVDLRLMCRWCDWEVQ